MAREVKFGEWLERGFKLYKENLGVLLPAALILFLLTAVSFGLLAGPLSAGMIMIVLPLVDKSERKPDVGTLFQGFNRFLPAFLFALVWGGISFLGSLLLKFVICVGPLAAIFGGYALGTLLMFGMFLIVEHGLDFWSASMESMRAVKPAFWPLLGFFAVASLMGSAGVVLCVIGVVLTIPLTYCALAVAYREFYPAGQPIPVPAPVVSPAPVVTPAVTVQPPPSPGPAQTGAAPQPPVAEPSET